jgi:hypothetical protein
MRKQGTSARHSLRRSHRRACRPAQTMYSNHVGTMLANLAKDQGRMNTMAISMVTHQFARLRDVTLHYVLAGSSPSVAIGSLKSNQSILWSACSHSLRQPRADVTTAESTFPRNSVARRDGLNPILIWVAHGPKSPTLSGLL